jgi:dephospho-CoA kinase
VGVASRTARQLSQEEKSQRADYTVRNDGTLDELKTKLSEVLGNIER